jgi:PAS domain S-box-containing protein
MGTPLAGNPRGGVVAAAESCQWGAVGPSFRFVDGPASHPLFSMNAPGIENDERRLAALYEYAVLDTWPETEFDELTKLAAHLCEAPSSLITFIDRDRQWFKSKVGFDGSESGLSVSFCVHAIRGTEPLVVADALKDPRFAGNPSVTAGPQIRFYVGVPLIDPRGHALGALCVFDRKPRGLEPSQLVALKALARHVIGRVVQRRRATALGNPAVARSAAMAAVSTVIEDAEHAFVAFDPSWRFTYVSAKAAQMLGRGPVDLIGRELLAEFPNQRGQLLCEAYRKAFSAQEAASLEDYSPDDDRWFEHRLYPTPGGLSVFFHDITEKKQAEALLIGQNQVLEMIARGDPLRETLSALLRFLEKQSPNMLCSVLLLDEDGERVHTGAAPSLPESFSRLIDGQRIGPRAGSCGTAAYRGEPVVTEDIGSDELWQDYRGIAIAHGLRAAWSTPIFDARRKVLGTFAIYYREPGRPPQRHQKLVDIATHVASVAIDRHRTEAILRRSEERYRSTLDGILEGCQLIGFDWRYLYLNDAAARHNRRPNRELIGRTMMEAWPGIEGTPVFAMLERCLRDRVALHQEIEFHFADGSRGWYDVRSQPVPEGVFALSIDVTERKRSEESLQASHAQLRALAARLQTVREEQSLHIAREIHDVLGQQLTAVRMELAALRRRAAGIADHDLQEKFRGRLGATSELVDATIETVQRIATELRPALLDKLGLAAAIESEARDLAERAGMALECDLSEELPELDSAACISVFRIVQEAFTNIARHAHASAFSVKLERKPEGGVVVEVADNGRGFSGSGTDAGSLGMLGMQERARLFGGSLAVTSAPGRGTTVALTIPLRA